MTLLRALGVARRYGTITALAPTASRLGYWIIGQNGDVYPFGDARFYGSTGGIALNRPIVTAAASRKT